MEQNLPGAKFRNQEFLKNLSQDVRAIFIVLLVGSSIVFLTQMASLDSEVHPASTELLVAQDKTNIDLLDEIVCALNQGESYVQCIVRDRN